MKKAINVFFSAVGAGLCIGIGGIIFLSIENRIIGSLMFTVGLYTIVLNGLNLFTGKVCYLLDNHISYFGMLAIIWLGNLAGTFVVATAMLRSRIAGIQNIAYELSQTKLNDNVLSIFILAVLCGMLMYIAVDGFKERGNPLILFICVSCFILSGFEHCIANMFYFSVAEAWSLKTLCYVLVMTVGNGMGGVILPAIKRSNVWSTKKKVA